MCSEPGVFTRSYVSVRHERGFTIIEIAIVVVIIGLLLGGVLAGQQLIRGAQVRKLISDNSSYQAAILGFNYRFDRMPGDFHEASIHLKCQPACLNGNGNRRVEHSATPVNGSEVHEELLVWSHLVGAGFIGGQFAPAAGGTVPTLQNSPVNISNRYWEFAYDGNFGTTVSSASARHNLKTGNQIPVEFVREVDGKIDDGMPNTGSFRFSPFAPGDTAPVGGSSVAPNCTSGSGNNDTWNATNGTINCGATNLM